MTKEDTTHKSPGQEDTVASADEVMALTDKFNSKFNKTFRALADAEDTDTVSKG